MESISHYSVGNLPHISCTLTYDINGDDDNLLRGELLTLIRIMRGRMRHRDFIEHDVVPVSFRFLILKPKLPRNLPIRSRCKGNSSLTEGFISNSVC